MFAPTKSRAVMEAEKILVEAFRITKLHNQKAMCNITNEDLQYLANNLVEEYLSSNLNEGVQLLKNCITEYNNKAKEDNKVEIGDFLRLCYSAKKRFDDEVSSRKLLTSLSPKGDKESAKSTSKEAIAEIRELLKTAIKPLPYNKDHKIEYDPIDFEIKERAKDMTLKKYEDIDIKTIDWDKKVYSDGPRLYEKCVSVGHIAPIESIDNPELRALYEKSVDRGPYDGRKSALL